jgi:hypothetical protein
MPIKPVCIFSVYICLFAFGASAFLAGCTEPIPMPDSHFDIIVLKDVEGLQGGIDVFIKSDGTCISRVVRIIEKESNLQKVERRYETKLTEAEIKSLDDILHKNNFWAIKINFRPGLPDTSHPIILVKLKKGESKQVWKWADDTQEQFDAIYERLFQIEREAEKNKPVYDADYNQGDWYPEGFMKVSPI